MRKSVLILTALAGQLLAGSFFLTLGNPKASTEARELRAVFTVKAAGCLDPATAKVTATAIGLVNGERRTAPLEVKGLSEPGMFAVIGQWPKLGPMAPTVLTRNTTGTSSRSETSRLSAYRLDSCCLCE